MRLLLVNNRHFLGRGTASWQASQMHAGTNSVCVRCGQFWSRSSEAREIPAPWVEAGWRGLLKSAEMVKRQCAEAEQNRLRSNKHSPIPESHLNMLYPVRRPITTARFESFRYMETW